MTTVVTTSGLDLQSTADPRLFPIPSRVDGSGTLDFVELLRSGRDCRPPSHDPTPAELAFLVYTSGTTGTPKGAMASHRNVMAIGQIFRDWVLLDSDSIVLAVAPLFHITGLMCQLVPCLITPAMLVLAFRYQAEVLLDAIRREQPTFAVGPVTAFIGMVQAKSFRSEDFSSFERIHSGGAPVSPATSSEFERLTGQPLLGAYGVTEATAATHLAPKGVEIPVDPTSGALAVGIPIPGVTCRIVDDDGNEVEPGTAGEVVLESPGVISGYWRRAEDTASTIRHGQLFSGDVGIMAEQGWLYLVDRKKDLIICSGFNVWPREVEDALYEHPSVSEVAVIGVPDDYRGETVKAFVSLKPGQEVAADERLAFARERLAAYKRPHEIEIQPELPKTVSGKILRRSAAQTSRADRSAHDHALTNRARVSTVIANSVTSCVDATGTPTPSPGKAEGDRRVQRTSPASAASDCVGTRRRDGLQARVIPRPSLAISDGLATSCTMTPTIRRATSTSTPHHPFHTSQIDR